MTLEGICIVACVILFIVCVGGYWWTSKNVYVKYQDFRIPDEKPKRGKRK